MSIKSKLLKGGASLAVGQAMTNVLSFARNIIIARLLSPADYGIASIFVLTITFLEMVSNLSAETLLIQAKYGDNEDFQSTVHLFQLIRGLIVAGVIVLTASFVADMFSIPEASWAFMALALVPLGRSFLHRDMDRLQRHYIYLPQITTEILAGLASTLIAIPMCLILRDYSAALWILILHSFVLILVSHVVARRKYRISFNLNYWKGIVRFGWPLLINGILMFIIFQGDRFIIGSAKKLFLHDGYTLTMLGWYSAAFTLTLTPSLVIARICQGLFLPAFSEVKDESEKLFRRYIIAVQGVSIVIGFFVMPFVLGGGHIIYVVFGEKYLAATSVIGLLAVMQAFRLYRIVPTIGAMAMGDTQNAMISNIARVSMFVGVIGSAFMRYDLIWFAIIGALAEAFGSIVSILRLNRIHNYPLWGSIYPPILVTIFVILSFYAGKFVDKQSGSFFMFTVSVVCFYAIFPLFMLLFSKNLKTTLKNYIMGEK